MRIFAVALLGSLLVLGQGHKKNHRRSKSIDYKSLPAPEIQLPTYAAAAQQEPPGYPPSGQYNIPLRSPQPIPNPPPQVPPVLSSLDILRGRPPLQAKEAGDVINYAAAGKDYPVLNEIPKTYFSCNNLKPGFYADVDTYCQVYHRCDISGKISSYMCPPKTLFNQITLVCDWFFNVNCQNSKQFSEYSNSRLYYPQWQLLDTQLDYQQPYLQAAAPMPYAGGAPPAPEPRLLYPSKQGLMYDNVRPEPAAQPTQLQRDTNPEYQMSLVIRNPQMVPDYTVGESHIVQTVREQMDQGTTLAPLEPQQPSVPEKQPEKGAADQGQPRNMTVQADNKRSALVPNHLAYAA